MIVLAFIGWIAVGFLGLEVLGYALHRWLFHGVLWPIHRTHHVARHGTLEWNDVFSIGFAAISIGLLIWGLPDPLHSIAFPLGLGFTLYGGVYFVIHDLFTHRRYFSASSSNRFIKLLRRAHLRHHQYVDKPGKEPFGLFLINYTEFQNSENRHAETAKCQQLVGPGHEDSSRSLTP